MIRRNDHAPRLELLPMIDVIFLLLTFFIYSLIFMVRAEVLPVQLIPLAGAEQASQRQLHVLMLDSDGRVFFDRQPVAEGELDGKLKALAAEPASDSPRLYLAVAAKPGGVDRAPLLLELLDRVRVAGISDFAIVGPPSGKPNADAKAGDAPPTSPPSSSPAAEGDQP